MTRHCLVLLGASLLACLLAAADWPRFRGPEGTGISNDSNLPVEFGPAKNVIWKTPLPPGHSSPVLAGSRIYLTAFDNAGLWTIALDRTSGKELWRRQAPRPRREGMQPTNSPASGSPAADTGRVVVFFGDFGLLAYSPDGDELWRIPLGPFNNANGHGSSPILTDGMAILICDQDTDSYLLAVDAATGKVRWKTDRPEVTRGYATPVVWRPKDGPAQLIVPGAYQTIGYTLATGEKQWWVRGMAWQLKGTPVLDGDTVYLNSWEIGGDFEDPPEVPTWKDMLARFDRNKDGVLTPRETGPDFESWYPQYDLNGDRIMQERDWEFYRAQKYAQNSVLAFRLGGRSDLTKQILWRYRKAQPNVPSPLLYGGALFLVRDGGIATTLDPKDGHVMRQARLPNALESYWASPVGADGKVYMVSEACKVTVLKATGNWQVLASNNLDDECFATPAIADSRIYLRTRTALYAFGLP